MKVNANEGKYSGKCYALNLTNIPHHLNGIYLSMKLEIIAKRFNQIPYISPWTYTIQRAFLMGLYAGGGGRIHGVIIKLAISI